ncbi:MAG: DUF4837 domain-containing protein [Flavobacteriaceae bacterium CG_4_8_14_3_um_filter_34_10]|nr:DUF4837 family protein [Flavobacteriia bacterium]OIP52098.1 MAG: DUF4837 domain-containing protein [Flavobacteriaceae bacterium CG2_30_34_30]PIQ19360.1 MAG: DUF4837 domain-containing protein [Flavobacteriaceae bacterium CG18_big_fil_WC_8_21_14_2_50_34_36]PIV49198.1 MAG: DUF4837 domain-containing protein [Flavobacteriaceae bacterium CG02_land_8_20_14_3_00_34_13]PIX09699.1 MAG: DUF4837 domain-containing protein [Flavobacteriaceae bacterium CG_4_8_14_3_um_filter_34_10]PIZ08876.1 MAG: DUF4837 d
MKKILFFLITISLCASCEDSKAEREAMLPDSSGNINNLQIVIADELWSSSIGETLRKHFASPVDGLPQEEPLFSINQLAPNSFEGFTQKQRIFIFIQKSENADFKIIDNQYAKPQKAVFISANTEEELMATIEEKADEIIALFQKTEIEEKQRRMSLSLLDIKPLEDSLGIRLKIPSAYRIAKITDNFAWLRKDIRTGTTNIMVYEIPIHSFENEETRIGDIIKMRDSIGKAHIEGATPGSYMITEEAYAPYLFTTEIDGKFAYETKGTWEVKNNFMAGPFVNYAIKDSINNRILVIEGFTFAPSIGKRDYQFELEAIIKSVQFK